MEKLTGLPVSLDERKVEEQAFIFRRLPGGVIGVRLTDSFMMTPRKSYSFRINFYGSQGLTTRRMPD